MRSTLVHRLDASAATGLALTLALVVPIAGGLGLGGLAFLRADARPPEPRRSERRRISERSRAAFSTHGLDAVTQLGATTGAVIVLAVALAIAETIRRPDAWIVPFLLVLLGASTSSRW